MRKILCNSMQKSDVKQAIAREDPHTLLAMHIRLQQTKLEKMQTAPTRNFIAETQLKRQIHDMFKTLKKHEPSKDSVVEPIDDDDGSTIWSSSNVIVDHAHARKLFGPNQTTLEVPFNDNDTIWSNSNVLVDHAHARKLFGPKNTKKDGGKRKRTKANKKRRIGSKLARTKVVQPIHKYPHLG